MFKFANPSKGKPVGTPQARLSRLYQLEAKYLSDLDQSQPMTVLHGRDVLNGTVLSCITDVKKYSGGSGKDKSIETTRYWGTLAMAFCVGRVRKLHTVYNSEVELLRQETEIQSPYTELYIPGYTKDLIRIYPGTQDQPKDPIFANDVKVNSGLAIPADEIPDYKNICYFAGTRFTLGASPQMPNIRMELFACPTFGELGLVAEGHADFDKTPSNLNGDVNPAAIIYDYLTNKQWGVCRLDEALIDKASFTSAISTLYQDRIYITSTLDSGKTVREAISDILEYIDGVLYLNTDGKIALKLIRKPSGYTPPTLDENWLTDEPEINLGALGDTWGTTKITFNDRNNVYEGTAEVYEAPYFEGQQLGSRVVKTFDFPFIKERDLAARTARRLGMAGSVPSYECSVKILPSTPNVNNVGDLFYLTFNAYGVKNMLFRVSEITRSNSFDTAIEVSGVSVPTLDWDIDDAVWQSSHTGSQQSPGIDKYGSSYFAPRALKFTESGYAFFVEESTRPGVIEMLKVNCVHDTEYFNTEYGVLCSLQSWKVVDGRFTLTISTLNESIFNLINAEGANYIVCCAFQSGNPLTKPILFDITTATITPQETEELSFLFEVEGALSVVEYEGTEIAVTPDSTASLLPGDVCYLVRKLAHKEYNKLIWNQNVDLHVCAVDALNEKESSEVNNDAHGQAGYFYYSCDTGAISTNIKVYDGNLTYHWDTNNIPWGNPLSPTESSVVTAASEPSDTGALWINSVTGEYSIYSNGEWTPTGDIIDLPTMQNYSGQTISETVTSSMTINLTPERNTFIHIKITDSPITVTLSDANNSAIGDRVTVICTSNNNARWTATLAGTSNNFTKGDETYLSAFNVATGTITELLCIGLGNSQKWMIASLSLIKQN